MAALLASGCLSTAPANAQCAPDPASSGQTVTCSGNVPNGFQAGGGIDNLTVNVLPGATVSDGGGPAIGVNDFNTITNSGTLTAGSFSGAIFALTNNTITNTATGTITVGDNSNGIVVFGNSTVTNAGAITTGSSGGSAGGIFAINADNTVTNTATATITVGDDAVGIFAQGNHATVSNAGVITAGDVGAGIVLLLSNDAKVSNSGTIAAGHDGAGISVQGDRATVSNVGAITTGDFGTGLDVTGDDVTVSSRGTIIVADTAFAVIVQGDRAAITNGGTVTVGAAGAAGIVFAGSSSIITNSGHIIGGDDAAGIVILGDSNTIINAGTITVGGGSAVGIDASSFVGSNAIINTGTINVGAGATGISISGGGTVFNSGTINAAAGTAAIEFCGCGGNVLTLGPGSVINGLVIGAGTDTFQLGGTGRDTFNLDLIGVGNQYDGFSTFNKVDSSNWTVTGTGSQDWHVLGGTLSVNGLINGTVSVDVGGTLGGTGTVGSAVINGGALAPGNSIGTLNVAGSLTFSAASSYMVEISGKSSDLANVAGVAQLGGATVVAIPSGSVTKQYTILTATGGVPDTFNPVVAGAFSSNLKASLSYDANNVYLNFALNFGGGLNVNQQNVANTITNFFNSTGGVPLNFASLTPAGLTQISGETATGSQPATFQAMSMFLGLMTDPFAPGRNTGVGSAGAQPYAEAGNAYAAARLSSAHDAFAKIPTKADVARNDLLDSRWSVWGAAYGGGAEIDGNAAVGSNSASVRAFGFAGGADYRISPSTLAGFALGGGGTSFSVNGFGNGRSDLFQAGAFVRHSIGAAYVTGALAYGGQQVTTDRTVTVAGFDKLHAQFNAHAVSGRVEGGTRFATPWMGITPYAAGQFTTFFLPAYAEQALVGSNAFALNYAAKDVTASRSELGVRTDRSFALESALLTLRGRVAWAHDFNTDRNVTAVFQGLPGASFVVNGAAQARNSALTSASAEMTWRNGWSAAATFEGEFSDISRSYAGKGVVRYAW
jgi:uncharacterized protein with beta-barrel porin domain